MIFCNLRIFEKFVPQKHEFNNNITFNLTNLNHQTNQNKKKKPNKTNTKKLKKKLIINRRCDSLYVIITGKMENIFTI